MSKTVLYKSLPDNYSDQNKEQDLVGKHEEKTELA
jgi:hypothetical protein